MRRDGKKPHVEHLQSSSCWPCLAGRWSGEGQSKGEKWGLQGSPARAPGHCQRWRGARFHRCLLQQGLSCRCHFHQVGDFHRWQVPSLLPTLTGGGSAERRWELGVISVSSQHQPPESQHLPVAAVWRWCRAHQSYKAHMRNCTLDMLRKGSIVKENFGKRMSCVIHRHDNIWASFSCNFMVTNFNSRQNFSEMTTESGMRGWVSPAPVSLRCSSAPVAPEGRVFPVRAGAVFWPLGGAPNKGMRISYHLDCRCFYEDQLWEGRVLSGVIF